MTSKLLSTIFQQSWSTGDSQVTHTDTLVNVVPIDKKGKKKDSRNYRPVSLTMALEKVMEQTILSAIM